MARRTHVARYIAGQLAHNRSAAIQAAAAWLVSTKRTSQAPYLARDVAAVLAATDYLYARIYTSRPLTAPVRHQVEAYLKSETGARTIELEALVDPTLLGGFRLETPTAQRDLTVRHKLAQLVEGAHQ